MNSDELDSLADDLGVSVASLQRLGIGWADWGWAFPMADARGKIRGVRVRKRDGTKSSMTGSRNGLFIPTNWDIEGQQGTDLRKGSCLVICEGPTDTAALLDLGFYAVGRPSCNGGTELLVELVKARRLESVVILADSDGPGQTGARALASTLVAYVPIVRVVTPPEGIKDAREWKRDGRTHSNIQAAIDAAPVGRLSIRTQEKGR